MTYTQRDTRSKQEAKLSLG